MVDKNLFLYDLAVTAIFKNEAPYLKEWLDYHLLAGVDHFYLYNNDSSDNYKEVLAPYIEKNLVTLTDFSGKAMQFPAYEDAIDKYRFECRYMAFIDLDEFIFPKSNSSVIEVVDEILSHNLNAAGLAINWQLFGSSGQEKADYSRGVLERFTRRLHSSVAFFNEDNLPTGNANVKIISNPRCIQYIFSPHYAIYFDRKIFLNSNGEQMQRLAYFNLPVLAEKIVINHYSVKSREEFLLKMKKGRAPSQGTLDMYYFNVNDHNEVFDDGILKYRAARADKFSLESDEHRTNRVINSLVKILTQHSPEEINLETFLTCRAVAEKFQVNIYGQSAEELALTWIYRALTEAETTYLYNLQMFLKALPEILLRPFPICEKLRDLAKDKVIPRFCEYLKTGNLHVSAEDWKERSNLLYLQKLLRLIK